LSLPEPVKGTILAPKPREIWRMSVNNAFIRRNSKTISKSLICLTAAIGFAVAVTAALSAHAQPLPAYRVTDVGRLDDGGAFALGINDLEQIVGYAVPPGPDALFPRHATLFDSTGRGDNLDLGTLPDGRVSQARAINNLPGGGIIVGYSYLPGSIGARFSAAPHAVVFGFGGQVIDLGTLLATRGTGSGSIAYGINDAGEFGEIVGAIYFGTQYPEQNPQATLFRLGFPVTRTIDLGIPPGGNSSQAYSINNAGQAVGAWFRPRTSNPRWHRAALFTAPSDPLSVRGTATDLGGLTANLPSEARAINNLGQIVGWSFLPNGMARATLFDATAGGDNISIGTLGGHSVALSINDRPGGGLIVGYSCPDGCIIDNDGPEIGHRAVLFGFGGRVIDLNTLIDPTDALFGEVTLLEATSINNVGEGQIVANGLIRGRPGAGPFLLTPLPRTP
jgi:uncharacterized membrane protein